MSGIAILQTRETIFFGDEGGKLRQWIMATIENRSNQSMQAVAAIKAGGEEVITEFLIEPGVQEYRCYAPVLWPEYPSVSDVPLRLTVRKTSSHLLHLSALIVPGECIC